MISTIFTITKQIRSIRCNPLNIKNIQHKLKDINKPLSFNISYKLFSIDFIIIICIVKLLKLKIEKWVVSKIIFFIVFKGTLLEF